MYPNISKIFKITQKLKLDKNTTIIDSYWPINKLLAKEKIIEEYIKSHLEAYFDINNIITNNHHWSGKFHGTNTAIAQIIYELTNNYELNNYTALLQTDLRAAFDTVDTIKLIEKLNFYGVERK